MENFKDGVLPPSSFWYPYISPTPGEFPIICWGGFSQRKERECLYGEGGSKSKFENFVRKEIQDITEAGFNAVLQMLDADIYKRKQDWVADSGLKVIIQPMTHIADTTDLTRRLNELVEGCDLSQVTAFLLGDEPKYAELNTWKVSYDRVIEIWKPVKKLMTYINLSINNEPPTVNTNQTYEDYMTEIRSKFRLPVWCYDHYPLVYKDEEMSIQLNFYKYLELFSKMSKQTGRPFWTFVQCMQLILDPKTAYPTYDRMHYAAFSALAYGAQGINYWTFQQRKYVDDIPGHPENTPEHFGSAPINLENNRTSIWTAVKRLNEKIRNYTSVFLGASLVLARHTGDHIWEGDVKYYNQETDDFGPLMNITTSNDGVLVARLKNKTANYLVVVNHSPYKSQGIKLIFDSTVAVYHSNLPAKPNQITPGTPDLPQGLIREYTLQPGGAEVFSWL